MRTFFKLNHKIDNKTFSKYFLLTFFLINSKIFSLLHIEITLLLSVVFLFFKSSIMGFPFTQRTLDIRLHLKPTLVYPLSVLGLFAFFIMQLTSSVIYISIFEEMHKSNAMTDAIRTQIIQASTIGISSSLLFGVWVFYLIFKKPLAKKHQNH